MIPVELALTTLGKTASAEIAKNKNAKEFHQNLKVAHDGGEIAGNARRDLEKQLGQSVLSTKQKPNQISP